MARLALVGCLIAPPANLLRAEEGKVDKSARLGFIKETLSHFELRRDDAPGDPLRLSAEPALWYTNPVRSARGTGATFFWHDGVRPAAVVSVSIRDGGKVFREMSLLQEAAMSATRDDKEIWSPRTMGKSWSRLAGAPPPGKNAARRLIQMRSMARRFAARLLMEDVEPTSIRVLPQPIYRYANEASGLIDGAIFAFVEATDPEALLLLEANADETGGAWRYTLARMTSVPTAVELDGQEIWKTEGYWANPRSRQDAYVEAYDSQYEEQ